MTENLLFAQLAKYDETTGYFEAVAADESLDKSQEIFDYTRSKPHFEEWSNTITKASGGKSVGNVRAMHGKVAAGKLTAITFDDMTKSIRVAGIIVDPVEKTKMGSGVYTGVSIGGSYVGPKWDDPVIKGAKRYEAKPTELSIVDNPCNGNAFFTVVKDGGSEELRKFHVQEDSATTDDITKLNEGDAVMDLQKSYDEAKESLTKMTSDLAAAADTLAKITSEHDELKKNHDELLAKATLQDELLIKAADRLNSDAAVIKANNEAIEALKSAPAPLRIAMHGVAMAKSADIVAATPEIEPVVDRDGTVNKALTALKQSLANPTFGY